MPRPGFPRLRMTRISEENFTDGISRLGVLLRRRPERESEKLRTRHSRRAESRSCGCRRAARIRRMNRVPGGPTWRSMEPRPICRCARATSRACTAAHYFRPCCGVFRSHDQARAISFAGINLPDSGNQLAHQLGGVSPRARACARATASNEALSRKWSCFVSAPCPRTWIRLSPRFSMVSFETLRGR